VKKCSRHGQATNDNIIWRMRIACYIIETTNTLRISNIYCFLMAVIVALMRFDFRFIHTLPVLFISVRDLSVYG
jgi:hypothetical protein